MKRVSDVPKTRWFWAQLNRIDDVSATRWFLSRSRRAMMSTPKPRNLHLCNLNLKSHSLFLTFLMLATWGWLVELELRIASISLLCEPLIQRDNLVPDCVALYIRLRLIFFGPSRRLKTLIMVLLLGPKDLSDPRLMNYRVISKFPFSLPFWKTSPHKSAILISVKTFNLLPKGSWGIYCPV